MSCVILSACAIVAGGKRRRSDIRAHQIVLACAYFDPAGRVMVTPQALLPTRKIVDHYIGKVSLDIAIPVTCISDPFEFRRLSRTTISLVRIPLSSGLLGLVETGPS